MREIPSHGPIDESSEYQCTAGERRRSRPICRHVQETPHCNPMVLHRLDPRRDGRSGIWSLTAGRSDCWSTSRHCCQLGSRRTHLASSAVRSSTLGSLELAGRSRLGCKCQSVDAPFETNRLRRTLGVRPVVPRLDDLGIPWDAGSTRADPRDLGWADRGHRPEASALARRAARRLDACLIDPQGSPAEDASAGSTIVNAAPWPGSLGSRSSDPSMARVSSRAT